MLVSCIAICLQWLEIGFKTYLDGLITTKFYPEGTFSFEVGGHEPFRLLTGGISGVIAVFLSLQLFGLPCLGGKFPPALKTLCFWSSVFALRSCPPARGLGTYCMLEIHRRRC